jgi:hypothetical protein
LFWEKARRTLSIYRCGAALLGALALCACSQKQATSDGSPPALQSAQGAPSAATTIPIPANQDVTTKVALPPGTHKVGLMSGASAFSCKHVAIATQSGEVSNNFTDADVPAKFNMTTGAAPGDAYLSVDVACHGGAADSQLVIAPAP